MVRVLLVNPPFYRLLGSHYNGLPLGTAYIASSWNKRGYDVWLYNADFSATNSYKTRHRLYTDSDQTLSAFTEDGPITQETTEAIVAFNPDVVGYSCYSATVPVVNRLSRSVQQRLPNALQIAGGPHVTLDDGNLFRVLPYINMVISGEAEGVGLDWSNPKGSRIIDLDSLPFPERDKFWSHSGEPMSNEDKASVDVFSIITARGCPWRCKYCASQFIWPKVIPRGIGNIVSEVAYLHNHWPSQTIHFIDDTFTYNKQRAMAIMQGIMDLHIPVTWRCEARADTLTRDLLDRMLECGCTHVKIGVESGSARILEAMNKGETKEQMLAASALLHEVGMPFTAYLMAGFPNETDDDLRQTIDFARELKADSYSISIVVPYFGTPLYRELPLETVPHECFFHQHKSILNHNLSPSLIDELWSLSDNQE